jgi:hypothetical protein
VGKGRIAYLSKMEAIDLLQLFFPKEILDHFDVVEYKVEGDDLTFVLEEKNELPPGLNRIDYESKGFSPAVKLQDFPLRNKAVFLMVRRRKWLEKNTGRIIQHKWELSIDGTKYTKDFGAFLKGLLR